MYLDHQTVFSEAQVPSTAGGAVASTNYIDLGAAIRLGADDIDILVAVTAITATPTLQVDVEVDSTSAFSSPVVVCSQKLAVVAGQRLVLCVPPSAPKEFLRLKYTVTGAGADCTITALFAEDIQVDAQKP